MAEPIRWGILGTGYAARQFAEGLRSLPDAKLVRVGSRSEVRAKEFADRDGSRCAFGHYEELAHAPDIDIVYIATTANRHREDCILCLNAGKPVLCEKPFTMNAREAREVIEIAREKRLFCMEAMWMRFQPLIQKARELIQDGAIGEVCMLTADFGVPTEFDPSNRHFDSALGGGAILDRGVYGLSLAFFLLGQPSHISSQATIGSTGVDEQSSVLLKYSTGRQAVLTSSLVTFTSNEAMIAGTSGRIVIHEPFYQPHRISIIRKPPVLRSTDTSGRSLKRRLVKLARENKSKFVRQFYYRVHDLLSPLARRIKKIGMPPYGNGYNYEAAEVMRCLRSSALESKTMPLDETLRIMETLDTIRSQWSASPSAHNSTVEPN